MLRNYGLPLLLLMIALLLTACAAKSDAAMEQNPNSRGRFETTEETGVKEAS